MLLCGVMIFALSTTIFAGFKATDPYLRHYLATILGAAVLTVVFTIGFYSRRTILIGVIVLAVAVVLIIVIAAANGASLFVDQEGNVYLRWFLMLLTALGVTLLSRFRAGAIVLFATGTFLIALIQFMYENNLVFCLLLFLCAAGMMIMYRTYINNVLHSPTVQTAPGRALLASFVLCLLVGAIGTGIFYGIVRPLNPPSQDVKILTKYLSLEVMEKMGIANVRTIHDMQKEASNQTKEKTTVDKASDLKDDSQEEAQDGQDQNAEANRRQEQEEWIKYSREVLPWLIPLLIAAVIAAVIIIKILLRKKQYNAFMALEKGTRIPAMYKYFLRSLTFADVKKSPEETPFEFAKRAEPYLRDFAVDGVGISELTESFVTAKYGVRELSEKDEKNYETFYRALHVNLRKRMGNFRYVLRFLWI